ncbi:hypothetical protein CHARACLAT_021850 [Characodon lateralis]|uniref:Uncharacterized protein n=1 Tax=Characodon lateralis TaxID=208331 RepID=A0ABU7DUY7_9TELE|nr:hypothetical protein [Characodon lateralis]
MKEVQHKCELRGYRLGNKALRLEAGRRSGPSGLGLGVGSWGSIGSGTGVSIPSGSFGFFGSRSLASVSDLLARGDTARGPCRCDMRCGAGQFGAGRPLFCS